MRLATTAALLLTAATLSACTDVEINKAIAALTGDLDNLTDEHAPLKADLAAAQSADNPATEAELNDLRQKYSELALKLESIGYTPEPLPSAEPAEPEPPAGPPPFECVSIFRVQTCEEGVLYMLDSQMGWILPGRTE